MSNHSITDARNHLSQLIDRALAGESVIITRRGRPVVELRPVSPILRKITTADVDWVAARRVGRAGKEDAGTFVRRMRDEEWR